MLWSSVCWQEKNCLKLEDCSQSNTSRRGIFLLCHKLSGCYLFCEFVNIWCCFHCASGQINRFPLLEKWLWLQCPQEWEYVWTRFAHSYPIHGGGLRGWEREWTTIHENLRWPSSRGESELWCKTRQKEKLFARRNALWEYAQNQQQSDATDSLGS